MPKNKFWEAEGMYVIGPGDTDFAALSEEDARGIVRAHNIVVDRLLTQVEKKEKALQGLLDQLAIEEARALNRDPEICTVAGHECEHGPRQVREGEDTIHINEAGKRSRRSREGGG